MTPADRVLVRGGQPAPRPNPAGSFDRGGTTPPSRSSTRSPEVLRRVTAREHWRTSTSARAVACRCVVGHPWWPRLSRSERATVLGVRAPASELCHRGAPDQLGARVRTRRHCSVTLARSSRFRRAPRERWFSRSSAAREPAYPSLQPSHVRPARPALRGSWRRTHRSDPVLRPAMTPCACVASTECISQLFRGSSVHLW